MPISPTVLLSPRSAVRLPDEVVDIPPPSPAPARPTGSVLYQILPVLITAVGMGIILVVGNLQGSGGGLAILLVGSMLMMGGGAAVSMLLYRSQSRNYRRGARRRAQLYYGMLQNKRDQLDRLLAQQHQLLLEKDPDPDLCIEIAAERGTRLWERSPADPDYLHVRAGLGDQPSTVIVRQPRQPDPLEPDPLVQAAQDLAAWAATVHSVPVNIPLTDGACVGIWGPRRHVLEVVRAMLIQLTTHHAPDELKLVGIFSPSDVFLWGWLRWLPHIWSDDRSDRYLVSTPEAATRLSRRLEEIFGRRRDAVTSPFGGSSGQPKLQVPAYVFLVTDTDLADSMPVIGDLSNRQDAPVGASFVFVTEERTHLPRQCSPILEIANSEPRAQLVDRKGLARDVQLLDGIPIQECERFAISLAPLRLRRVTAPNFLPSRALLLDLLGVERLDDFDVLGRWRTSAPQHTLAVPVGLRPGGEVLQLDLHQTADGPHGLVAGSTGSGKSAFLQALLLGLAATFHPHELALVLVDYKGGSTIGPLRSLPHVVGMITNLDGNLALRALVALQAEIERRQVLLSQAGCDDLDVYLAHRREGEPLEPVPHLVLVVDEFAELKTERPDFIHQLVRTARVGRSVGVHLILSTQKPRPAVDEEIWANARFRVCLRVEQPQDSQDVLKRPDAASLVGRGQGYLQVGHDEVFTLFQGGWGGAAYRPDAGLSDPHEVVGVGLDGSRTHLLAPPVQLTPVEMRDPTQAEALAQKVRTTASEAGIQPLPSIWIAPLPDRLSLADLHHNTGWDGTGWRSVQRWVEPVLGLVDDPSHRRQDLLTVDLAHSGNLAIYGAPGAGKTTALLSLGVSLASDHSPLDVHLYMVDFGGHSLSNLALLPHAGGVVLGDEEEQLVRLLRHLSGEMGRRKTLFAEVGASTLSGYRSATQTDLPALVILIDNLPALITAFPDLEDELAQLAQQGGTLGIHLVFTAATPALVRMRIATSFTQAIALRLADRGDYSAILSLPQGYESSTVSGRGLASGRPSLECQVALPERGFSEVDRIGAVRRLSQRMSEAWSGARPWRVRTLPDRVFLDDLLQSVEQLEPGPLAVVGLAEDTLEPMMVDLRDGPHFMISGPPGGGKSTLLRTWLWSLASSTNKRESMRILFADLCSDADKFVADIPGVQRADNVSTFAEALEELLNIQDPSVTKVVAIDDLETLQRVSDEQTLQRLTEAIRDRTAALHVVIAGNSAAFMALYDGAAHLVRQGQTGFVVGGTDFDDVRAFGVSVPPSEANRGVPPGRGLYARRKRYVRLRAALPPTVARPL
jgi:S-DNA-T family DNA segregation ATPase FtsK/SpoIIIE